MTKEIVLSVTKKKTKYHVVTTENRYTFQEETIIKYQIFKGNEFTNNEIQEILDEENTNSLFNKTINYLSYQARSINEVKKYLESKEASIEEIENIIEKLTDLNYLNDEIYAKSQLDYAIRTNKGPKYLEQKLVQKQVDESIIFETVRNYSYEIEATIIDNILDSLITKYKTNPIRKQKNKIYEKLLRDGFSSEVINEKINKINFIDESFETLIKDLKNLLRKHEQLDEKKRRSVIVSKLMNKGYDYSHIQEAMKMDE